MAGSLMDAARSISLQELRTLKKVFAHLVQNVRRDLDAAASTLHGGEESLNCFSNALARIRSNESAERGCFWAELSYFDGISVDTAPRLHLRDFDFCSRAFVAATAFESVMEHVDRYDPSREVCIFITMDVSRSRLRNQRFRAFCCTSSFPIITAATTDALHSQTRTANQRARAVVETEAQGEQTRRKKKSKSKWSAFARNIKNRLFGPRRTVNLNSRALLSDYRQISA